MESEKISRYELMINSPIPKLINKMAFPSVITILITALYNLVDTLFVSLINTSAAAASGIVFPVMSILQAVGLSFGIGAASYISRLMGQKEQERAKEVVTTAFISAALIGGLLMAAGVIWLEDIIGVLGSTGTVLPYATEYARYILIAAPFFIASMVLNATLRAEGSPILSLIGILIGTVLNVILDPLFIFTFNMGIAGAAIATGVGQFISFAVLLGFYLSRRSLLRVRLKYFKPRLKIYFEIFRTGMATFIRTVLQSAAIIILNIAVNPFGDSALAAFSICGRMMWVILSIIVGFGQGYQPISGYNFGANRIDRVLGAFWHSVKMCCAIALLSALLLFIFAEPIMKAFRADDLDAVRIGASAIRWQCLTLVPSAFATILNMAYQSIGKGVPAAFIAAGRQGIFLIPIVLTLPNLMGLDGVYISQPLSDGLTFLACIPLAVLMLRKLKSIN